MTFLEHSFYGNSLRQWLFALAIAVGVVAILRIVVAIAVGRLVALSRKPRTSGMTSSPTPSGRPRCSSLSSRGSTRAVTCST